MVRRLAVCLSAVSAALFAAHYLIPYRLLLWLAAGFLLFGLAAALWRGLPRRGMAVCLCAGLAVGLLWRYGYVALKVEPLRQYHETTQHVVGTVVEEATDYRDFSQRLVVDTLGSRALLYLKPVPELAELRAGDIIEVECKLRVPLPGETDDVLATKRSKGIFLVGVQDGALSVERRESVYWTHQLKRWSVSLRDKLMATLPQPVSSLATGVFFGYKAGFSPTQEEQIRVNGLAHVVSVSGMHIAFLMGFLLLIFGNRRWAFVPALLVLLLFVALVGFPASAMRAYIMQAMLLLAYVRGRPNDTLTALAVALAVLLLFNPFAVADVGLQLSFAATLGIALFAARWQAGLTRLLCKPTLVAPQLPVARLPRMATATWRRLRRYIIGGLATSMAALVLSTPLIVYYFGTLSLVAPISTLLVLWAVAALFLLTPLYLLTLAVWAPLASLVGALMWVPATWMWGCIKLLGSIPFASLALGEFYAALWLCGSGALALMWMTSRQKRRLLLPVVGACVVMLAATYTLSLLDRDRAALTVTAVDVGQGQAILAQSNGQTLLIDCGSLNADAAARTLSSLGLQKTARLDAVLLTHGDADHTNGLVEVAQTIDIGQVLVPVGDPAASEVAGQTGDEVLTVDSNRQLSLGEAQVYVFAPVGAGNRNDAGLAVLLTCKGFSLLITGDMSTAIERVLAGLYDLPHLSVLMVGHHGSKHSTGDYLLTECQPEAALISVGRNSFGHPGSETLQRLRDCGADIYRTDELGNLTIRVA